MIRLSSRWFSNSILGIALITLAGAALRLYGLDSKSLWLDEAIMYWVSRGSIANVIAQNAAQQSSPPLFALLSNLLSSLGDHVVILRAPSWIASIIAIPCMYWLARQFLSKPAAYFCALITALSVTQIQYSQQAREYALTFLVAVLMIGFFYRFTQQPTWIATSGVLVSWTIGIFLQYGLGILALALNIVMALTLLVRQERKSPLVRWALVHVFVLAAVFVVYQLALAQQLAAWPVGPGASSTSSHLEPTYWNGSLISFFRLAFSNTSSLFYFAYPNLYLVLFISLVGLFAAVVNTKGRWMLLIFGLPVLVTFAAALARKYPYDGVRQDIFLLPMFYVLAGFGFEYLWNVDGRRIAASAFALLLGLGALGPVTGYYSSQPENIKPIVDMLNTGYGSGDHIYVYYGANPAFRYYHRTNLAYTTFGDENRNDPERYYRALDPLLAGSGSLWLVFSHCYNDECQQIANYAAGFRKTEKVADAGDATLYVVDRGLAKK